MTYPVNPNLKKGPRKVLRVRNCPEELHERLSKIAKAKSLSLEEVVVGLLWRGLNAVEVIELVPGSLGKRS